MTQRRGNQVSSTVSQHPCAFKFGTGLINVDVRLIDTQGAGVHRSCSGEPSLQRAGVSVHQPDHQAALRQLPEDRQNTSRDEDPAIYTFPYHGTGLAPAVGMPVAVRNHVVRARHVVQPQSIGARLSGQALGVAGYNPHHHGSISLPVSDGGPQIQDRFTNRKSDHRSGNRRVSDSGASPVTYATGYAAYNASIEMIDKLKVRASRLWSIDEEDVQFEDGVFSSKSDSELSIGFKDLAGKLDDTGGPVTSTGSVDLEAAGGAYGTHICDLEIDPETGKTDVVRYTIVQDAGRAIHPSYVEGQMQGGAAQGIGWALNEEYYMSDDGVMSNSSYLDYRMPTSLDLPSIETVIVEVPNPVHPYGVRGVGEVPIVPPVPAVGNAIKDAIGIRLRETPMNAGRIVSALESENGS